MIEDLATPTQVVQYGGRLARGETGGEVLAVAGRIVSSYQEAGRLAFWMLSDGTAEVQVALTPQRLGDALFAEAVSVEVGGQVQAVGRLTRSRRGILTILATGASWV